MERSKEITDSLLKLRVNVTLDEPFLTVLFYGSFLKIKKKSYDISDKPGCGNLRPVINKKDVKIIEKVSKQFSRSYDLNYPRTIKVVLWDTVLKPQLGLSGTVYHVSDIEMEFARDCINAFSECQRLILSSLKEKGRGWKKVFYLIDNRTFWKEKFDLEKISRVLCGVQKFLNTTFLDIIVDLENMW